ncbi:MAG: hypothetical protein FJ115_10300 [Deltaproteobacteria bacterium]|nr:hypothetical protein [Deltaproteobacteria bacterium]MBM4323937.1 hypothetical protein [Deltaproteobacteria bacterium]
METEVRIKKLEAEIEAAKGVLMQKSIALRDLREKAIKKLELIRYTEVTDDVVTMREKIKRNNFLLFLLAKYGVNVEKVAIAELRSEDVRRRLFGENQEPTDQWLRDASSRWNIWDVNITYHFGSPGDPVKVLFRQAGNGQYFFCGFITDLPLKQEKRRN